MRLTIWDFAGNLSLSAKARPNGCVRELGGPFPSFRSDMLTKKKRSQCFAARFLQYLNYPFGWRDRVLRQTSFPSKLATYIAAGRPLLLHTPADSTTAELATIPGLSYHWDDLNVEHGVQLLKKAWADPADIAWSSCCARRGSSSLLRPRHDKGQRHGDARCDGWAASRRKSPGAPTGCSCPKWRCVT